jgi:putative nucleotidyltransferase-like protein
MEAVAERLRLLPVIVGELDQAGRGLGICLFGIKGLAARDYYPDPSVRQLGDWDVYVESEQDAWALAGWLRRHDYSYYENELPWYKRELADGWIYGQIMLRKQVRGADVLIDIHYGGYSVRHCALLRLGAPALEPGWHTMDRVRNTAVMVANAAGDQFITTKDLNDLALAVGDQALDWPAIKQSLAGAGLQGFFNNMLRRLTELFDLSPAAARAASAAAFPGAGEPMPPFWQPDSGQRWSVTVRHAYSHGRRSSLARGVIAGATAARYYRANLRPRAVPRRRAPLPRARPWTCVRLVPLAVAMRAGGTGGPTPSPGAGDGDAAGTEVLGRAELSRSGAMQSVRTTAGELVEAAGELFLPTVYYKMSEALIRTGAALQHRQAGDPRNTP